MLFRGPQRIAGSSKGSQGRLPGFSGFQEVLMWSRGISELFQESSKGFRRIQGFSRAFQGILRSFKGISEGGKGVSGGCRGVSVDVWSFRRVSGGPFLQHKLF